MVTFWATDSRPPRTFSPQLKRILPMIVSVLLHPVLLKDCSTSVCASMVRITFEGVVSKYRWLGRHHQLEILYESGLFCGW